MGAVAVVLKGYPRLSETFIAQEIRALEVRGLKILIYSLRPPRETGRHPIHGEIIAPVVYLPERLRDAPRRVSRALLARAMTRGFWRAVTAWVRDLSYDLSMDRIRRFGQGAVMAYELDREVDRLYAHFMHTPASVTRYASLMTGLPWSCSAHARDIWTIGEREKSIKLEDMEWLVTCTDSGYRHLTELAPDPEKVSLVYHGIDLSRFAPPEAPGSDRDGADQEAPVELLSVGRPVEKKGYDVLLDALATLPDDLHWRFRHIGEGALLDKLKSQAEQLGLQDKIIWSGAQSQDEVIEAYRGSDVFVLPCRIAADGDRDGLPNVLLEAQSQGLACLSTNISGIPELIDDERNGRLVRPDDVDALASALEDLIRAPEKRRRFAKEGLAKVTQSFSHTRDIDQLAERFGLPAAPTGA